MSVLAISLGYIGILSLSLAANALGLHVPRELFFDGKSLKEVLMDRKLVDDQLISTASKEDRKIFEDVLDSNMEMDKHNSSQLDQHMIYLCGGAIVLILSIINSEYFLFVQAKDITFSLFFCLIFFGCCLLSIITSFFLNAMVISITHEMALLAPLITEIPKYLSAAETKDQAQIRFEIADRKWRAYQDAEKQLSKVFAFVRISNCLSYFLFSISVISFLVFSISFIQSL